MTARNIPQIVLLVEDEPVIRVWLIEAFQDAGFGVLHAADGDRAVQILERNAGRVCAVFSDINLPGSMNGVLLAEHARKHWPSVPVVLASGRPQPHNVAISSGARFFQKPYDINSVVDHVRELTALTTC
jgi:DNA-binding response OmpR family regulator